MNAAQVSNAGSMTAGQNAALNVSGTLSNAVSGTIHADGKLAVNAGSLANYGSTDVNGQRGEISGQMLVLNTGDIANAGNLLASQGLTINSSGQVLNALGTIQAGGILSVTAAGNLENLSGIVNGQETAINVQTIDNVTLVSRNGSLLLPMAAGSGAATGTGGTLASLQAMFGTQNGAFLNGLGLQLGGAAAAAPAQKSGGFLGLFAAGSDSSHTDVALQQAEISATGGALTLNAAKDINGAGAKFSAGTDFIVNAGGSVAIGAQELTSAQGSVTTVNHVKSTISAGRDFIVNAGGDTAIVASDITVGRNAQVVAQGGVTFGAAQDEYHEHSSHTSCDLFCFIGSHTDVTNIDNITPVPTTINAGGWVEARSKTKDVVATATTVNAQGNIALIADLGNVSEVAGLGSNYAQSYSKDSYVFGLFGSASGATSSSTVVAPSFVSAKGDLTYFAHGDLTIKGSGGQSGGTAYVTATNVNVTAVEQLISQGKMSESWGLFASGSAGNGTVGLSAGWKDTKTVSNELQSLWAASSLQAGGGLVINATGNVNVFGSTVTAADGISIQAAQVNVTAAQDTLTRQSNTTTDTIGLMPAMNNGLGFAIGAREVGDTGVETTVTSVGGLIGSTGGAVVINASEGINVRGGVIGSLQADSTILNAPSINVSANADSFTAYALHTDKFVGLNVSIEAGAANPLSGVQKGASYLAAAENTKDPQAKLLYEAAAGAQGAQGLLNLYKAESAGSLAQAFASFDIKVGIGVAVSSSESTYHTEQASGGMVLAAKSVALNATGGDLTLTGATVYAPSVTLSASRDIVQQSLALNTTASSKSSSFSAFAGVDFGMGLKDGALAQTGFGLTASASDFAAQSQTVSVSHAQTTVTGGYVSLSAGRDIDLYGAAVSGTGLAVQAGRDLNIVSDRDTEWQTASLTSWNLGGTIGLTGMPSSFSAGYAKGSASGDYASVTATSGLFAGAGGYAVTVGGTTTLTGGALASTADASKNSLTTGALVTKDLANSSSWKASSSGLSVSYSTGGIGGLQPGLSQKTGGSSAGLAQATIAPGNISIVNAALQKSLTGKTPEQVVAALNRATAAQNKAADKLPGGLAQTLQNQADRSLAMIAASSSTAKLVGDVAGMLRDSADQTIAKYTKTPPQSQAQQDELDAAKLQANLWGEDGAARILVHGATQGVLAWIGGGYSLDAGLRGAGGAMAAAALGPILKSQAQQLLKDAGIDDPKASGALASLVSELAVTGIGSAFGNVGAVTAASVDMNNRQLHQLEIEKIKSLAKEAAKEFFQLGKDAEGNDVEPTQEQINRAEGRLMAQALRDVDQEFRSQNSQFDPQAEAFLDKAKAQFADGTGNTRWMFSRDADFSNPYVFAETKAQYAADYARSLWTESGVRINPANGQKETYFRPATAEWLRDLKTDNQVWDGAVIGTVKGVGNLTHSLPAVFLGPDAVPLVMKGVNYVNQNAFGSAYTYNSLAYFSYSTPEEAMFGNVPAAIVSAALVGKGMSFVEASIPMAAEESANLLPKPNAQGVASRTIYVNSGGDAFVGKLPQQAGPQPIQMEATAPSQVALDWSSITGKTGETRPDHVIGQHGDLILQKPSQGVFYGDPVDITNDAWKIVQDQNIAPINVKGADMYVVPRPNSGYAGGYSGQRQNLDTVTIITVPGTSKLITAYPGNGLPPR